MEEEDVNYEVERIIKKRIRNGRAEYFVKWKNFDERHNRWLPEESMDCDSLLMKFEEAEKKKKLPGVTKTKKMQTNNDDDSGNKHLTKAATSSTDLNATEPDDNDGILSIHVFLNSFAFHIFFINVYKE